MTENEIKMIEKISDLSGDYKCYDNTISREESLILDRLLTEIQQYREIGTIEEFKALKEKNVVKPTTLPFYGGRCTCGIAIGNKSVKYCYMCGAKLDWEGGE